MDLSCGEEMVVSAGPESRGQLVSAAADPLLDRDPRVLNNILDMERMLGLPTPDYFYRVQTDVQPFMRKVVTTWMLEVCEEQMCENQVFPLAVRYVDRFLSRRAISRQQLQLLAVVALLVASKVCQCAPLSVPLLCAYTDHSVTPDQVRSWELVVLGTLSWQSGAVTAFDAVEPLLARLAAADARLAAVDARLAAADARAPLAAAAHLVRRHAHTLVAVACTETEFLGVYGSEIAAACVCAAARGLGGARAGLTPALAALVHMAPARLRHLADRVELMLAREAGVAPPAPPAPAAGAGFAAAPPDALCAPASPPAKLAPRSPTEPNTPTDLRDIHF